MPNLMWSKPEGSDHIDKIPIISDSSKRIHRLLDRVEGTSEAFKVARQELRRNLQNKNIILHIYFDHKCASINVKWESDLNLGAIAFETQILHISNPNLRKYWMIPQQSCPCLTPDYMEHSVLEISGFMLRLHSITEPNKSDVWR